MCGIAGMILFDPDSRVLRDDLERMARAMAHRGPDASGCREAGPVGCAFRRLSIIDRSGGNQPIHNETGRISIVFNGEIYNFQELRQELSARGHDFRTNSDTETILHGYEEWGARGVCERLRGMFAFAIHDGDQRRVILARDRLGIKPLHVARVEGRLWFASELKSLLALDEVPRQVDDRALLDYASLGYVPAPATIFKGMEKVLPGYVWTVEQGRIHREQYWKPDFQQTLRDSAQAERRLLEILDEAVACRLVSEVPLGCFLSGGLDSSAVVSSMVLRLGTSVNAVTVGFDEQAYDERDAAREVANYLGITSQIEEVRADPGSHRHDL